VCYRFAQQLIGAGLLPADGSGGGRLAYAAFALRQDRVGAVLVFILL